MWPVLGQWHRKSEANSWQGRDGAGLLSIGDDLFLLGGWNTGASWAPTCNEVWRSRDRGQTWQQLPDAPWEARHTAGWLVHNSALWVIGGDANRGHYQRDVWRGDVSPDGVLWVQVNENAAPLQYGRVLHNVWSFDGALWLAGGQTLDEIATSQPATKPGSPYYTDIWKSVDGANWQLVSDTLPWTPRGMMLGNVVKDGLMWVVGGGVYATKGYDRTYLNDIWNSEDGVTWQRVCDSAPFVGRQYHDVIVRGQEIIVVAGFNGANIADAWASTDGISWRQLRGIWWPARHASSVTLFKGEVLFLGGTLTDTGVWGLL